jgi:hypothetical protein
LELEEVAVKIEDLVGGIGGSVERAGSPNIQVVDLNNDDSN